MGIGYQHDVGSLLAAAFGSPALANIDSDSSEAGVAQAGATIDRLAQSRRYLSAKVIGLANVVLAAASSGASSRFASFDLGIQDSADGITWAAYVGDAAGLGASTDPAIQLPPVVTATASSTGTPAAGINYAPFRDVDISRARRYIRTTTTVSHSATSSATANRVMLLGVGIIFGGADAVPAT